MSEIVEVPSLSPTADLDELRAALHRLIENTRTREPLSSGDEALKFITRAYALEIGLVQQLAGGGYTPGPGGGGGVTPPPGGGPDDPIDYTPPDPITGLGVTAGLAFFMVEFDAPTYEQGGGNAYTEIYAANYAGTGPLPTFANAVMIGTVAGRGTIAVIAAEPGQRTHFWAGAVTGAGVRQVDTSGPTGGTNGVWAVTALDVSHLLEVLTGQITESQLYAALNGRIDLIDGPTSLPGSVNARVLTETTARISADAALASDITTLTAQFIAAGRNLLPNSSFEMESDDPTDGLADDWLSYEAGSRSGVTLSLVPGRQVGLAQRSAAAGLGNTTNDRHGVQAAVLGIAPGSLPDVIASAWVKGTVGTKCRIIVSRYVAGSFLSNTNSDFTLTGAWQRVFRSATLTGTVDELRLYLSQTENTTGGAVDIMFDDAMIQPGTTLTDYAPGLGDWQTSQASVRREATARADGDEALATVIDTLTAQFTASGKNMLLNSSFEIDQDGNGVANDWPSATVGTTGTVTRDRTAGRVSGFAQRSSAAALGNTSGDRHGFTATVEITPGSMTDVMASAWARGPVGTSARILVNRYTAGSLVNGVSTDVAMDGTWKRISRQAGLVSTIDEVRVSLTQHSNLTGGPVAIEFDEAMLEPGTVLNDYTPGMGDFIAAFSAVLQESTARASADDALATSVTQVQASLQYAGTNLLANSSFEHDTNADGVADEWTGQNSGAVGTASRSIVAGRVSGQAQRIDVTAMPTSGAYTQVYQDVEIVPGSLPDAIASVYLRGTAGAKGLIVVGRYLAGSLQTTASASVSLNATGWTRVALPFSVPSDIDELRIGARLQERPSGTGAAWIEIDDIMMEEGEDLHPYSPGPGDSRGFYAAVREEAIARASVDGGLLAQWTVKLDVAGLISGFGLASTAGDAAPTSAFGVRANQFWVAPPSFASSTAPTTNLYDGYVWLDTSVVPNVTRYYRESTSSWVLTSPALPFIIQTTPQTINGEVVPPGIYMTNAYMARLVATRGQIGLLAVDDARIASCSVGKLTAGSLAVGEYAQSTGYVAGSAGWRINGSGVAEFSGVIVRGTVYASAGLIGGATIDTSGVRSNNYVFGVSGWRLDNATGQVIAYAGRIGGAVIDDTGLESSNYTIGSAGWRLDNATGQIRAYSGVLGAWTLDTTSLRLGKTAYGSGTGIWMGTVSGSPRFDIGSSASFMRWDGTDLLLSKPLFEAFSASIPAGNATVSVPGNSQNRKLVTLVTRSVSVSGGRSPYSYQWMAVPGVASEQASTDYSMVGSNAGTMTLYAYGTGETHQKVFNCVCLVTDANGRVTTATFTVTANLTATGD